MLLTDDERRRFAEYLEGESQANRALAEQCNKLSAGPVGKMKFNLAMAQAIVAKDLRGVERQEL